MTCLSPALDRLRTLSASDGAEAGDLLFLAGEGELIHVAFDGSPFGELYVKLLDELNTPEVGGGLRTLTLRGPDEGANGTRNWDLTRLVTPDTVFPHLTSVFIEPTAPEDHNVSIVGADYEEAGQIGRLLRKAPTLRSLTVPSAPDAAFFAVAAHPLRELRVDAGYDHQDFIANLACADCFSKLLSLDYTDVAVRDEHSTPVRSADYERLLSSPAFGSVRRLTLRNPALSEAELKELQKAQPDLQIFVIRWSAEYIRR